eukprot:m.256749 g.256749  ORF g.256749 m.256749 type:complete len:195 (+) comp22510_c0_seq1:254-838(+)
MPSSLSSLISAAVTLAYFAFYTAYDKGTKKLTWKNIQCLFTQEKGVSWTLVEINKVLSLAGLTLMLLSFLPHLGKALSHELHWTAIVMLWPHSVYSCYKFYGFQWRRFVQEKKYKQVSVVLGLAAQLVLSAGYLSFINYFVFVASAIALSLGHFYTMEMDYKGRIQVRPFAYLPFPLAAIASLYLVRTWIYTLD